MKTPIITAYIGIGSNMGDSINHVERAIRYFGKLPMTSLDAASDLYQTAPINATGQDYINAVVRIQTQLKPEILLQSLQSIETEFGRERPYINAPRTLDLDILLYGEEQIHNEVLTIPHPRMTERAFVLIPLLQIAPSVFVPGAGLANQFLKKVAEQMCTRVKP